MEVDKEKIKRFSLWAIFLILIGGLAAFILPEHAIDDFFGLLRDVITSLII